MLTLNQVKEIIEVLSSYEGFVSEAHFQHAFALELARRYPNFKIYPEFKVGVETKTGKHEFELDLLIFDISDDKKTCIEMKYKTANAGDEEKPNHYLIQFDGLGEKYHPKNQGAQDLASFNCWCDIERLDLLKEQKKIDNGFFIFVTNDREYYDYSTLTGKPVNRKAWKEFKLIGRCTSGIRRIGLNSNGNTPSSGKNYTKHNLRGHGDGSIYLSKDYGDFVYEDFGPRPSQRERGINPPMDEFKCLVLHIE